MLKRYLSSKPQTGAPYIPELRKYLVDSRPNGELVDEVDVYGMELLQPPEEISQLRKRQKQLYIALGVSGAVVLLLLLAILLRE